ncbi:MAG: hypothetical protein KDA77_00080 [Planctomycetaceae bacterium]|nr:hypothetical protein [Planctomycetaceae bacterium]
MAHFLIYLPGEGTPDPQYLVDAGLSDLAEGYSMTPIKGPDGKGGLLVSWNKRFEWESGWTWKPSVPFGGLEAGRYWYGIREDSLPTPNELQRPYRKLGKKILLDDGNEWLIPFARELPSNLQLADDGSLKFVVQRQYHDFFIEAESWSERLMKKGGFASLDSLDEVALFVMQGIQLNYRLTKEVISDLRLFTKENLVESIMAICGLTYVE